MPSLRHGRVGRVSGYAVEPEVGVSQNKGYSIVIGVHILVHFFCWGGGGGNLPSNWGFNGIVAVSLFWLAYGGLLILRTPQDLNLLCYGTLIPKEQGAGP